MLYTVLLVTLFLPGVVWAADRFVAPGGGDAGAGDRLHPWRTLQYAADSGGGDTVHIAAGAYAGFRATSGGRGSAAITLCGGWSRPGADHRCVHGSVIEIEAGDYLVLDGLEVSGAPTNLGIDVRLAAIASGGRTDCLPWLIWVQVCPQPGDGLITRSLPVAAVCRPATGAVR
ncbi:MAG: hypothetical protein JW781_06080 [Deltaproteobacteria bacterium]|nr:hypothetical protein [Candidatus Anaeroferrophillacea bacterium]